MKVSVVLVTHNRPKLLRLTLQSLAFQSILPDEIIVIDDASRKPIIMDIMNIIERLKSLNVHVKILRTQREIGLGAARTLGARIALGEYIVFLDDDAIASNQLIKSYIDMFEEEKCDIIAGPCYPQYLGVHKYKLPSWWDEHVLGGIIAVRNDVIYLSKKTRNPMDYVFGCNFAINKRVLEAVKGFKPWLGRVKGMLLSGEEWDFVARALNKDFKVCFSKNAMVYHLIPYSKISLERVKKMSIGMGRTRCVLAYEHSFHVPFATYLIRCTIAALKDIIEALAYIATLNNSKIMKKLYDFSLHLNTILLCRNTICKLWGTK